MQEIPKEILTKAQEGDLASFEVIYRAISGFVYNVAFRVLGNRQDAEEVTQEVFLNIYRKLKYFNSRSSLKTWAYRIAVNCAINYAKKISRERNKEKGYYEDVNPWQVFNKPKMTSEFHNETINLMLKTLNPDQRTCIVLRNIEGLSYQQIADALKISINTVRTRLKRAREKLLIMKKEVMKNEL